MSPTSLLIPRPLAFRICHAFRAFVFLQNPTWYSCTFEVHHGFHGWFMPLLWSILVLSDRDRVQINLQNDRGSCHAISTIHCIGKKDRLLYTLPAFCEVPGQRKDFVVLTEFSISIPLGSRILKAFLRASSTRNDPGQGNN